LVAGGHDSESTTLNIKFNKKGVVESVGKGFTSGGGGGIQDIGK
jgi:hypothetical protein